MADGKTKNIVVLAHSGAGKTSIVEAILFNTKAATRLGSVDNGTSHSDYLSDEKKRKISISSSILHTTHKGCKINIIDTPGYADFIGEVVGGISVSDAALLVVCGVHGVEVGTGRLWKMLQNKNMPVLIFVNKLDKENSDFLKTLETIKQSFGDKCIPFHYPKGKESSFEGVINLLSKEDVDKLSGEDKEKALKLREAIIESAAESEDALTEKYLEGKELTPDEIIGGLKKAISQGKIVPVLCGSAIKNISVDLLPDVIVDFLPASDELGAITAFDPDDKEKKITIERKKDAPFSALAFKTISDPYVGQLTLFRVYSGILNSDTGFFNSTKKIKERIGHLYLLQGKEQEAINKVEEGDIAAVAKLKSTMTSDTLCDEKRSVCFEPIDFPEPVISFSITPNSRADEDKISQSLAKLSMEEPTLKVGRDQQTKELIISGMGDLHLEVMVSRLKENFGVGVTIGTPKVAYKETVTKKVQAHGKYKKQSGGRGQYGDCWIELEPLGRGKNFEFVDKIVGGAIPRNYIPSVEKGIRKTLDEGVIAGHPLVDVRVTLYDGSYHTVDSSDIAFQIAGAMALRKATQEAKPILLEPIMSVDIVVPEDFMGQISSDLSSRRGRILGMEVRGNLQVVKADIPLAEMFKYATELRSMTHGKGSYSMKFSHYEHVPQKITQGIVEKYKKEREER